MIMENVFRFYGSVILTTTVGMIVTSLPISVETTTVRLVGVVARDTQTIVAYLSGCTVMERMTAGTDQMSLPKIAPRVNQRETSNVKIVDVFLSKCESCISYYVN